MTTLVSLGRHCQAAHQINRVAGKVRPAQFFDWLITPHDGLIALLKGGFAGFLAPGNLQNLGAHEGHHHVIDAQFGVEILHDFPIQCSVEDRLAQVQGKYAHLARRFMELPGGAPCVFVRQVERWDAGEAAAIQAALGGWFRPGSRLMIVSDMPIAEAPAHPDLLAVHVPQPDPYIWRGSDPAWDKAFERLD